MASSWFSLLGLLFALFLFLHIHVATAATTHLHFYLHDTLSGATPSAIRVVSPLNGRSLAFGDVIVVDDPLTEGPGLNTTLVGRAQGFYMHVSQEDLTLMMMINLAFLQEPYNGSSLAVVGRNAVLTPVREFAIVGGSGQFRLARGYVEDRTYSVDPNTGDGVFEFDVYVKH